MTSCLQVGLPQHGDWRHMDLRQQVAQPQQMQAQQVAQPQQREAEQVAQLEHDAWLVGPGLRGLQSMLMITKGQFNHEKARMEEVQRRIYDTLHQFMNMDTPQMDFEREYILEMLMMNLSNDIDTIRTSIKMINDVLNTITDRRIAQRNMAKTLKATRSPT